MVRKCRIEEKGAIYHVIHRGNNREYIFKNENDKKFLLQQLMNFREGMNYKIYGFVLMDNHYHILLQTLGEKLQKIMHRLNTKYSKHFNRKYNRCGHVFQGKYKSIFVQDERYLFSLIRYIHQNPIRAGICEKVQDYKWSSDFFYRNNINNGIDIDMILNIFSKNRKKAIKEYEKFINVKEEEEKNIYEDNDWIGQIVQQENLKDTINEISRKSLDEILRDTGVDEETYQLIKNGSRKRNLTQYKVQYIFEAMKLQYTMQQIGLHIAMKKTGVYDLKERYTTIELN